MGSKGENDTPTETPETEVTQVSDDDDIMNDDNFPSKDPTPFQTQTSISNIPPTNTKKPTETTLGPKRSYITTTGSKLFQPHRTIGYITSSAPFTMCLTREVESQHSFICVPLLERFIIYRTSNFVPVFVSDCLPSTKPTSSRRLSSSSNNANMRRPAGERMYHAISNTQFKVTLTTHSHKGLARATHTTLYSSLSPLQTLPLVRGLSTKKSKSSSWGIVNILDLGNGKFPKDMNTNNQNRNSRMYRGSGDPLLGGENSDGENDDDEEKEQGEKEVQRGEEVKDADMDKKETWSKKNKSKFVNQLLVAVLCSKLTSLSGDEEAKDDDVEIVGDSDSDDDSSDDESTSDDTSSSSEESSSSTSSSEEEKLDNFCGEVIILRLSQRRQYVHARIPLKSIPNFTPTTLVHPHTYLNKILIGSNKGELILLNIRSGKIIHQFSCLKKDVTQPSFKITVLEQSPAVDTIAVGTDSGEVHLINIRLDVKLFTLYHAVKNRMGSEITTVSFRTDSSALDQNIAPMAVGQKNGTISVWDLTPRTDDDDSDDDDFSDDDDHMEESQRKKPKSTKAVQRTLLTQIENAHKGGVSKIFFLPQEPLLLSSGLKSNSLIMHIFDNPNHSGRILRQKSGHSAPPRIIRYKHSSHGGVLASMKDGTNLKSCSIYSCGGKGDRSFRLFNTNQPRINTEFGQGKGMTKKAKMLELDISELKLKEVTGMAVSDVRAGDWGDIVTIHENHSMAYVWSSEQTSQSGPVLRQDDWNVSLMKKQAPVSTHATSVVISSCGNFAMIGTKSGVIYKYNIQSGLPNGSFPQDATKKETKNTNFAGSIQRTAKILERDLKADIIAQKEKTEGQIKAVEEIRAKHLIARHTDAAVVGLAVDTLNKILISVDNKSKLIVWSFATHNPHKKSPMMLSSPATKLAHIRDSDLTAIAHEDFSVSLFDCATQLIVRRFGTVGSSARHTGPITDVIFGPDGRKLYTSSIDGTLRVWDVPTNTCVDWMTFASPPIALSLSCTGEFLATAHQGRLGISLFCDKSFFKTVHLDGVLTEPFQMDEPTLVVETSDDDTTRERMEEELRIENLLSDNTEDGKIKFGDNASSKNIHPEPKREGLITLSGLPAAHWKNLFNLELVKERNKPTEAPKKPVNAPFFLQWRSEVNPNNSIPQEKQTNTVEGDDDKGKEWNAVWSDDDEGDDPQLETNEASDIIAKDKTPMSIENKRKRDIDESSEVALKLQDEQANNEEKKRKNKITTLRSELASLLVTCSQSPISSPNKFEQVTKYLTSKGPAAIDVELSGLCNGMHDLQEGIVLLKLAASWLVEACKSRQNYEAINAYLHRFLHLHSATIAGIDMEASNNVDRDYDVNERLELLQTISELRLVQRAATEKLRGKMQHSLCLLRHFSRMI